MQVMPLMNMRGVLMNFFESSKYFLTTPGDLPIPPSSPAGGASLEMYSSQQRSLSVIPLGTRRRDITVHEGPEESLSPFLELQKFNPDP
jgi:hypothetical protein